jgi:hypothetical protein
MKTAPITAGLTVLLLVLAAAISAIRQSPGAAVELVRLTPETWQDFVPQGKEVDAIYGDYVLRNRHLTAVIAQPTDGRNANMTVRDVGGALIDLTTRDRPSDQLSAFYPGKRNFRYADAAANTISADGKASSLPLPGESTDVVRGETLALSVTAPAAGKKPKVTTTYRLAADQPYLDVITEFANPGASPLTVELEDDLRIDHNGREDMIRAPNGEAASFWAYDRHWNQAYSLTLTKSDRLTGAIQMNSDARLTTLKYVATDGTTTATIAPGETLTISRRLMCAPDLLQLRAVEGQAAGAALASARFTIRNAGGSPLGRALVELLTPDETLYGSARTTSEGTLDASLPAGRYAVRVAALGNRLDRNDIVVEVKPGGNEFELTLPHRMGRVDAAVTDADGRPIPCKVEFRPRDPGLAVDFGPESAEFAVKNLRYTPNGKFTQELLAGEYDVLISHGPEYDLIEQRLSVAPEKTTPLAARLVRSVDTTGWVSSDFHSHSSPSGDNTSSQLGRVLNLVCEHIEFAPCTEHNRIDTYVPHIERLGVRNFVATVSGMELTGQPLPLNHQNAFPLKMTPRTQNNGAPPIADNLEEQIERLALWDDRSEKLVQVNHPDIGWMFYDKNGDGQPDGGFERAVPYMDVVEVHPIDSALHLGPVRTFADGRQFHNTVFRWLQLLNQGYRIYGVVNTDAHYNFHGSGWLRNWIQSSTDDPAKIDPMEMVHAAEQGRLVMSNGPFLEVWANEAGRAEKVTCGQDLTVQSRRVALKVRVQCPNWLDIDRVFVLVNGRVAPQHDYTREKTPNVFRSGVVKFDETLEVVLAGDAHLIVVAGEAGGRLKNVTGVPAATHEPTAISNPIYVDVDGDGFQPTKDTLDHPLPVKFGAGQ